MKNSKVQILVDPLYVHYLEHIATPFTARHHLLGSHFYLESNDQRLIQLAAQTFAGVPKHRFPGHSHRLKIRLILQDTDADPSWKTEGIVPELNMFFLNGVFCATMGPRTISIIKPQMGTAQIVVSNHMMAFPYNVRYELIQYAASFLAQRSRGFVSLNGACVALKGRGLVLIGDNGAGKSTTSLACLEEGFDFIAEEGLTVCPTTLLASGIPGFLHLRPDSLRFFKDQKRAQSILKYPTIVRRNGVPKLEIDTRKLDVRLAPSSVKIRALVFLSGKKTRHINLIEPLTRTETREQLDNTQPDVSSNPQWRSFLRRLSLVPAYAVSRGDHPKDTVAALREIHT